MCGGASVADTLRRGLCEGALCRVGHVRVPGERLIAGVLGALSLGLLRSNAKVCMRACLAGPFPWGSDHARGREAECRCRVQQLPRDEIRLNHTEARRHAWAAGESWGGLWAVLRSMWGAPWALGLAGRASHRAAPQAWVCAGYTPAGPHACAGMCRKLGQTEGSWMHT